MSITATSRQLAKDVSVIPGSSEVKQHVLLLVDDDPSLLITASDTLNAAGYQCLTARSASQALITLKNPNYIFDLMISDVLMSGMSGIDLMKHAAQIWPSLRVIVMSGTAEIQIAVEAHRAGAADYLIKPFDQQDLIDAVSRTITQQTTARRIQPDAHDWNTAAKAFALSLDARDKETEGHAERVVAFSVRLGHELGMCGYDLISLELGARLHDIGKIAVPDSVLKKPGPLTEDEWTKMKIHPVKGQEMVRSMGLPETAALIVGQHHERWDGKGYPDGLKEDQISLGARIFAVADTFDAITSDRIYRRGRAYQDALKEILTFSGIQFDPAVVEAFIRIDPNDWQRIRSQCLVQS
ncbi:MAG TPA: HD domain-containing phosphohydrolase [Pyrinomonadaceae bacterium]|nr:HD domain-containing phosphohydrolase [Pyrinomonadaceae bacterium]